MKLNKHGLCPATYLRKEDMPLGVQMVIRPPRHSRGRNLYVTHNEASLDCAIKSCGPGWYGGELINKVAEYRVFVVQGRAVAVAQKTPGNPEDVAWNVAKGGRFDNVRWDNWPLKAVKVAIAGFELSSLDFGGVDVMVDADGEAYILEINSAPSLTSEYRQTCMAKAFDYIIEHGKERIPLVQEKGGYRKFIHPAVCERAQYV
jgi:glutathione synthase/RimK-type ligase-like ATP-grasp enzyme